MGTVVVIPYSFPYTVLELLTKFPCSRPRRMAGREGEGTSGIGLIGMLGLRCRLTGGGGREAASPSLTELGGAGRPQRAGMGPRPRDWDSLPYKREQW